MRLSRYCLAVLTASFCLTGCEEDSEMRLDCEKTILDNGLTVLLCEEGAAPVVTVGVLYHVGANREQKGKTGFAHLFEHLMFSESQHVPQKLSWRLIQGLGGTMNGWTSVDHTFYHETLPVSGLETALWMESDRMGYLMPTMTKKALAVQQGVVINEKRQTEENVPYGYDWKVKNSIIYGPDHPCGHTVIGETEDLQEAKLADVCAFHEKYYVPANATLVICGRFDKREALALAKKYFGSLPGGTPLEDPKPNHPVLPGDLDCSYVDGLAASPDFSRIFIGCGEFEKDSVALKGLAALLCSGKESPFYRHVVETGLAPSVDVYADGCDITGEFTVNARPLPGIKMEQLKEAFGLAFADFEKEHANLQRELDRYKARCLREFYAKLQKSIDKAFLLAFCDEYAGSYGKILDMAAEIKALTLEDIWAAYGKYIKGKPSLYYATLPKGAEKLALPGTTFYPQIKPYKVDESRFGQTGQGFEPVKEIASAFDRSAIPAEGPIPEMAESGIKDVRLNENARLLLDEARELPMVELSLILKGGQRYETTEKSGLGKLTGELLLEGTEKLSAAEFDGAIRDQGASVSVRPAVDCLMLRVQVLKANLKKTLCLLEEALLSPAFTDEAFQRILKRQQEQASQDEADPECQADSLFYEKVYGHIPEALPACGTSASLKNITLKDVKDFYENVLLKGELTIAAAGDCQEKDIADGLARLVSVWEKAKLLPGKGQITPAPCSAATFTREANEDASQSEIRVGLPAVSCQSEDYFKGYLMNYMLGGSFCSRLNLLLREEKAYTYGCSSYFDAENCMGAFLVNTAVDSQYEKDALSLIDKTLREYPDTMTQEDLDYTKATCRKALLRQGETISARRQILEAIARNGYPTDYLKKRLQIIDAFTLDEAKSLAKKYVVPDMMQTVVVGPEE